jgi:ATP-dependent Lon protease
MNRIIRTSKSYITSIKILNGLNKNISTLAKSTTQNKNFASFTSYNSETKRKNLLTKTQRRLFSNKNDKNDPNKEISEKESDEKENKSSTKETSDKTAEKDIKTTSAESAEQSKSQPKIGNNNEKDSQKPKKKSGINLFLEEETESMNDFLNIDKDDEIEIDIEGNKRPEKSEFEKKEERENLIKFPLIYNMVPIIPYSKLTLTNLHRNDLFFSLIMKYGRLNLVDEEKNYIEDIAVFFEKEEYLKTHILGTVCKVTYINQEKLVVEGLDKMYSIKSEKLGKLKFFYPSENTQIKMENEVFENTDYSSNNIKTNTNLQLNNIQECDALFKEIKESHDYILNHLKLKNDFFGEYDVSFDFDSESISNYIQTTPDELKTNSMNNNVDRSNEDHNTSESIEQISLEKPSENFQNYLSDLFKFTYYFIHKVNTFSNSIYNHSDEFQNILQIKDLKKRLVKIKEAFESMINLIKLKHVFYQFPTDLKLKFENPFAKQTEPEINRILKYKEALENKLSEVDTVEKQKEEFRRKLKDIVNMNEETKKIVEKEINKISNTNFETENGKRIEYINHIFALPWDTQDDPEWDLDYCKKILDTNLYGLQETKERIYEFIAKNMRKNNKKGCVILLTGGPGTGKTRIAKLIGESLKRKVGFISLAGMSDGKGILGFKRTYISSTPGVLIKEMQKLSTINPVIVIDEIDKVNYRSNQSNVYHALLQLLNVEENHRFVDHYLEIPFDFSNVIFILTSNNEDIFPPLIDRMEVIKVDPYIYYEKFLILKNFAQKQILNDYCYNEENFKITDQALYKLIYEYCKTEAGVRKAKKLLEKLVRRINAKIETENELELEKSLIIGDESLEASNEIKENSSSTANKKNENKVIQINSQNLAAIINTPKDEDPVLEDMILNSNRYGFCVGLFVSSTNQSNSWGSASIFSLSLREIKKLEAKKIIGESANVDAANIESSNNKDKDTESNNDNSDSEDKSNNKDEAAKAKKKKEEKKSKFKVSSSGNLGEDSIQSLTIALNIATDMLNKLHPELADFFYKNEIHQHVPQVLLPKSGPSAGVVLLLCAMSLALKKNIIPNLAMTGEVCIDGTVLKIGGVKEKAQGAQRYGIRTLVIPHSNKYDFLDLPDSLKNTFNKVYFAKNCQEIYNIGFGLGTTGIDCYTPPHSIQMSDFMNKEIIEENNLVDYFYGNKANENEFNFDSKI